MAEPGGERPARDPGLAAERTDIAWARSGLAAITCLAGVLRRLASAHVATRWAVIVGLAVVGVVLALVQRRGAHRAEARLGSADAAARRLTEVAVGVTGVGVLCLTVALLSTI